VHPSIGGWKWRVYMASEGEVQSRNPEPNPVVRSCISCGRTIDFNTNVCPYCGYDYRAPIVPGVLPARKSAMPLAGGALVLIAGLLALVNAGMFLTYSAADLEATGVALPEGVTWDDVMGILKGCAVVEIILGVVAVLGGIFAIQRKHFGLAIAGSLMGMFGFGMTIGALLGLIGLILIALSRKEFQ